MKKQLAVVIFLVALVAVVSAMFIVREGQQVLVVQFGEPKRIIQDPGLYFKLPMVQSALFYDARVLDYDHPDEEVIAKDKKRIVLDTYSRYRIVDPLEFRKSVVTEGVLDNRFSATVSSALRNVVGRVDLADLLSAKRDRIMNDIKIKVDEEMRNFGIEVLDVRIRRSDLPKANSQAIFERMKSEREREAKEFRAEGAEAAKRITSKADKERAVILANARRDGEKMRGEGDGEAIDIYINAFGQDPEFFAFYRSMTAYRNSLANEETTIVISPNSDFFRFFGGKGDFKKGSKPQTRSSQ